MKRFILILLPVLFICASISADRKLADTNQFAFELYKSLIKNNDKNLVFSPYSILQALGMSYDGAAGNTKTQMQEVLNFSKTPEQVGTYFKHANSILETNTDSINLTIANGLWGQSNFTFLPAYLNNISENYNAPIEHFNFKKTKGRKKAAKQINNWVNKKTKGNITKLIDKNDLNRLTRLVLTNAIWFKADWKSGFNEENTKNAPFENLKKEKTEIPFMHQTNRFFYSEDEQIQIISIPYKDNRFSLIIALPKSIHNYNEIEKNLNWKSIKSYQEQMTLRETELLIPKFKMESDLHLEETLQSMGMSNAFSDRADFSVMTGDTELKIDKVIHKATIDVSEKGTEASAATAVTMVRKTAYIPPVKFYANKPFVYLIYNNTTNVLLFMGRYVNTH